MDKVKLIAKTRNVFGHKTNQERNKGSIPAVLYGRKTKSKNLWINAFDFSKLLKKSGESTIIELELDKKEKHNVLIYDTQKNPVTDDFIHIDFFQVQMDEEIETKVELVFVGEAPAVKELGGVLVKNIDEITVKCLPADLPGKISIDISVLKTFEDHITIKNLKISDKIKIDIDPETVVALVAPPRTEEELESLSEKVEEDVSQVEGVEKEGEQSQTDADLTQTGADKEKEDNSKDSQEKSEEIKK